MAVVSCGAVVEGTSGLCDPVRKYGDVWPAPRPRQGLNGGPPGSAITPHQAAGPRAGSMRPVTRLEHAPSVRAIYYPP